MKKGFTLVELLIVVVVMGVLILMLLPAIQSVREAARKTTCRNNMKNVLIATINYHSSFGRYPVGVGRRPDNVDRNHTFITTWAGQIAPHIEESRFDAGSCICSKRNRDAMKNPSSVYLCPSMPADEKLVTYQDEHHSPFLARSTHIHPPGGLGGQLSQFLNNGKTLIRDNGEKGEKNVPDGLTSTIAYTETTGPSSYKHGQIVPGLVEGGSAYLPGTSFTAIDNNFHLNRTPETGGMNAYTNHQNNLLTVGFIGGNVGDIRDGIDLEVYARLLITNDAKVISSDFF